MLLLQTAENSFWLQICCYRDVFIRARQGQANLSYSSVNDPAETNSFSAVTPR